MAGKTVLVASNNAHKASEIEEALAVEGWEFKTLAELGVESDPDESAEDFLGNARIKAESAREASGGMAVVADDSGLEVDALGGAPGVRSARYAGEQADDAANNAKLLAALADIAPDRRTARFVSVIVFIDENGEELVARGEVKGVIGTAPRGSGGFGYDPLFYPDDLGGERSFAELSQQEKAEVSHRGRALRMLAGLIEGRAANDESER